MFSFSHPIFSTFRFRLSPCLLVDLPESLSAIDCKLWAEVWLYPILESATEHRLSVPRGQNFSHGAKADAIGPLVEREVLGKVWYVSRRNAVISNKRTHATRRRDIGQDAPYWFSIAVNQRKQENNSPDFWKYRVNFSVLWVISYNAYLLSDY